MANGYVTDVVLTGQKVRVFLSGINNQLTELEPGTRYYLSLDGTLSATPPTSGISQDVGVAVTETQLVFHPYPIVELEDEDPV